MTARRNIPGTVGLTELAALAEYQDLIAEPGIAAPRSDLPVTSEEAARAYRAMLALDETYPPISNGDEPT
jgi:hypothetical protein